jgi:glycosyltransferase involved in cell wall biosynthesis
LPSVRYRAKYFLEHLCKSHDIKYDIVVPGYRIKEIFRFLYVYFKALIFKKNNSLIVIQKVNSGGIYARFLMLLIHFRRKHTIYDTDDADYTRFPPSNIHYFMINCSRCTVGSLELKNYTQKLNKKTFIITTPVFTGLYKPLYNRSPFTIGWIGFYRGHVESLNRLLFPALRKISFQLNFILLGVSKENKTEIESLFNNQNNINLMIPEDIDWYNESEIYRIINSFSIGISPLVDNEFNRSKSAFKLKQYQSCGIPVLGSPVGENALLIRNGENGYVCNNSDEFAERIAFIYSLGDSEYKQMCNNSYDASFSYSFEKVCSDYINIHNYPKL